MSGCWKPARRKYGVAVASYSGASVHSSLSLQIGETVQIWEEYWTNESTVTWLRGCSFNNKNKRGIFPAGYVEAKECLVENEGPAEIVTPIEDAIIRELTFVLREWNGQWKSLFVKRSPLFQTILMVMGELCKFRSTLVSNTLTKEHAQEMKHQVVTMIDWGNGQLGMDLVPRVDYQQVNPENVSVVEMFRIHERSMKNCQGALPGGVLKVKAREKQGEAIHHLLVSMCSFACSVGDNSEVLLSLYDSKESKFVSEKFVMHFTRNGEREGGDKNSSTIFTDLNSDDFRKELYLVVQILRKGRLLPETGVKKMANIHFRRPWGVSVLALKDLLQASVELEYFLRVQCVENESFANMHEILIKKQTQLIGKTSSTDKQNQGITLSLKLLHGDIKTVKIEHPMLFSKGIVLTQRMGFPDLINPGEIRNDLYLTLLGAELDRGSKTASKNVEVRVTVYNDQNELIKDCILPANGDTMKPDFLSYVLYHNNSPKWNETIRLSIPIEKFSTAHIRLELYHCSHKDKSEKKMFGFAFLSVTTKENTTRMDGKYDLCIYKCEDFAKVKNYLRLPSLRDDFYDPLVIPNIPNNMPYQHSNKECITIETLLCSSKFAQKAELLSVLQWSSNPNLSKTIPKSLDNLVKLKGQELCRYLQDILDALFNMFTAAESQPVPFASNIFETLVCIFNLLHEEMFEKFSVVLEDYLEKSFSSPLAHKELMHCVQVQAERVYTCSDFDEKSSTRVFKVLEDIFKFSVKSCMLSQRMYGEQSVKEFRGNLNNVFDAFGRVVHSKEKELQKVQAQLLKSIHKTYTPLLFVISNTDLATLVVFILNKITHDPGKSVIKAKTNLIKNTINSQLMWDSTSRSMLLPLILVHLKKSLSMQHHLELTANTLGDLLTAIYKLKEQCDIKDEVTKIIQGVFDVTMRTLAALQEGKNKTTGQYDMKNDGTSVIPGTFDLIVRTLSLLPESKKRTPGSLLVACLIEMLRLMDANHYQKLMNDCSKTTPPKVRLSMVVMPQKPVAASKEFLNRVLMVFRNLVRADELPSDWTTMRMITNSVMLTSIQYITDDLTVNFLQGADFDRELWYNFFLLAVDFITQTALQLERYSEAKSSQIKHKYNDMRVPVGSYIYSLWKQLGHQNKLHFILELIGPFLKTTMIPQLEVRMTTIPIFFDIMQCEYQLNGHLRRVENRMMQDLDSLVIEHNGDEDYKKLFKSILLDKVQAEPELREEGKRFVFSLTDLLDRLLNYREIMDREEQRDTKMTCTFNILNFYKDNRRDMYIRYICRLYELHYSASNFVEAGLTLRLYAQLLTWSQTIHQAEMSYPQQTEAERKELLFARIMDCFDKGKAWEYGIPLCKELGEHYEKTFQYKKLGQILQKQAYFLYQILEGTKLRQEPSYYRVAYFGNTFPPYLKNKAFIYRGDECLKLATIMSQLMTEYPSATILTTNSPPDESFKLGDAQYIQIVSVKPVPSKRAEFEGKEVPNEISAFYKTNEVDLFQFDRPYHRDRKDENNEFKSLCLERTIMQTSYKLPGILRWYEVTSTQIVQLGPVQTATETVVQMNAELKASSERATMNPEQCLRHLEMRLHGVISGAVNGGIPKYQEAFFNKEYIAKYPGEALDIEQLKTVILEQIQLLDQGLAIHGKLASAEMQPLHKNLADTFTKIRNSMGYQNTPAKNRGSVISNSSGSLRPSTPSTNSQHSSGSNRSSSASAGDASYAEDDAVYGEPPECLLPTYEHSPVASYVENLSSSVKPPPLPGRKNSQTSGSFSEHDRRSVISVCRSDSSRSTESKGSDTSQSQTDNMYTVAPPIRSPAVLSPGKESFVPSVPPVPEKRPSIFSISNNKFSGSSSNINRGTTLGYSNFSQSTSAVNKVDVNESTHNRTTLKSSYTPASIYAGVPPLAVQSPSRKDAPKQLTLSSSDDKPPPLVPRSPSNKDSPQLSRESSSTDKPPPLVPRSPSNKHIPPLPNQAGSSDKPPALVARSTPNKDATQPLTLSSTTDQPPPLVARSPSNRETVQPSPTVLQSTDQLIPSLQSSENSSTSPSKPQSQGDPPPIPKRKPSIINSLT